MTDHKPLRSPGNNHLLAIAVLLLSIVAMGLCVSPSPPPADSNNGDVRRRY